MSDDLGPHDADSDSENRQYIGHPTIHRHLSIHQLMQKHFGDGLDAPAAAQLAGINPKTAYKHYHEIENQIIEEDTKDMFEREKRKRAQIITTFDNDIIELTELLDCVKDEIKKHLGKGETLPQHLISQELSIIKLRFAIKDKKAFYIIRPTFEEVYQKEKIENV